jgi:hypothetical protein
MGLTLVAHAADADKPEEARPSFESSERNISNWPDPPERQGGRPYAAIIKDDFGDRQRNFESGRK